MGFGGGGGGGSGIIASGAAASRPAAGTAGRLYWATDTNEISFDTGSAWNTIGQISSGQLNVNGFINFPGTGLSNRIQWGNNVWMTGNTGSRLQLSNPGQLWVANAGYGVSVAEGSNAKQGTAVLVAGTVVVANTSVTATSRIFLTTQTPGGTPGALYVSARTAGTSFTVTSTSGTDTSTFAYEIFEAT